jgi:septal ring-binding cell division protein DamX
MSFEGEIGEIDLIQRLVELGSEQFTGAIRFESDGIIKIVYFKGGDVLSASTNDRTDAVDEILLRANKVTREHVKQALAKRKESETLGDALLGLGFITRKELTWARRVQVIGILRSIIGWKTGSYTIVADYLPKREEGTLFPLSQIIVELVVTDTDRTKSEQAMESGNAIFEKAPNFDDSFRRLGLNEDAEQIVAQIDGTSSAADVAARSGKDIFNVYKLLEALRLLKLVTRADKPLVEHEVSGSDVWDVENPDFTIDDVAPTVPIVPVEASRVDSATMEIPALNVAPAASVWDDPADDDPYSGTEIAPPPIAPPAAEPQWGFDEAQIEAARRAAVPLHADGAVPNSAMTSDIPPPEPRKSSMLTPLLLLLLVAAGAYGGWNWWQKRQATPVVATKPTVAPAATATQAATTSASPLAAATPPPRNAGVSPAGPAKPALSVAEGSSPPAVTKPQPATTSAAPVTTTAVPPHVAATTTTPITTTPKTTTAATHIVPTTTTASPLVAATTTTASVKRAAAKPSPKPAPIDSSTTHLERTAAGATITNASSTPKSTDATRAKYDGMASDFAAQKGGNYTLQFELVCETTSVTRALSEGGGKVWFVRTSYRNRPCYRVFWGRFDNSADANTASKELPASLGSAPVVVKIPR